MGDGGAQVTELPLDGLPVAVFRKFQDGALAPLPRLDELLLEMLFVGVQPQRFAVEAQLYEIIAGGQHVLALPQLVQQPLVQEITGGGGMQGEDPQLPPGLPLGELDAEGPLLPLQVVEPIAFEAQLGCQRAGAL
ncbi:hypothetical protein RZS08_23520, partial [Arthrospira platensis SPKY1]|nr:hypothetical protein [Arthrospira platensis SPKY1]